MCGKMKKAVALLLLFGLVTVTPGHGQDRKDVDALMRKKLQHAQKILESIAVADYDKIAKHADELIVISNAVEWRVMKTPQYEVNSNQFRRAAEDLSRFARARNLDAAALSYMDLTLSCVKCHKYVREIRMTRNDDSDSRPGVLFER